ncbi:hypothetical protein [Polaromonas sp. CG9_12]|nr:hypothetical protein [Polaromonas sp. CG9_12]
MCGHQRHEGEIFPFTQETRMSSFAKKKVLATAVVSALALASA